MSVTHLTWALEEVAGAALVLDDKLRVVAFTPGARDLLGVEPTIGVAAPKLLCGHGQERPVAEALAAGRSVTAEVMRSTPSGRTRAVRVRASPFTTGDERAWLLTLDADSLTTADDEDRFGIITADPQMKQLLRDVRKVAKSDATVLVRGETGSGKELLVRAIHRASPRAEGPFRAINCAALPPNLLESTLFGHERGAFTGAVRDAPGHFRLADGGTLFLDEVAELPLEMQAKLLRVLQEKTVIPVGGRDPVEVDVRVVSATHRALRKEVEAGRFRADLLYRLRVIPLYLPPLRERPEDIELLAWHFLERNREQRAVQRITDRALEQLTTYDWPGNVRELENVVEYAVVMGEGPVLTEADLPPELRSDPGPTLQVNAPSSDLGKDVSPEARRLLTALERAGGHMGRAAASLGISRTTLWRKLKRAGLDRQAIEGSDGEADR